MNRKNIVLLTILYLNYFLHGIGCSILGQSLIKDSMANSWGTTAMAITSIAAALGLGRLVALPIAGPLSDKFGRKRSIITGSLCYALYLIGLGCTASSSDGYSLAYVCAILGGIANSFLDTGIYPALTEIVKKAPAVATMGIKFSMALSQMLLPLLIGMAFTISQGANYTPIFWISGIGYILLALGMCFCNLPDSKKDNNRKSGLWASILNTHFSLDSIAMILIGFTCTGTFQLWLNCAQNYAKDMIEWSNPSAMQTWYSIGTILALLVTAVLTRYIRDIRFIVIYPLISFLTLLLVILSPSQNTLIVGSFSIGWAGAGGLLQIVTSVCNQTFQQIKGSVTALVMIASSLCNYTLLTGASALSSTEVMWLNVGITALGIILGLFVNLKKKRF